MSWVGLLFVAAAAPCFGTIATCRADGTTDATACLEQVLASAQKQGDGKVNLPLGTYLVSHTLVIPNNVELLGEGRGDVHLTGTVILAASSFVPGTPLVKFGPDPGPNFGVKVEDLTVNCNNAATIGIQNQTAEDQSYGKDLLIVGCSDKGLDIETVNARNSGPWEDLEIYPRIDRVSTSTLCVNVHGVKAFRGISGLTCNPGAGATIPATGIYLDGDGLFQNIHVEHATTAISLGDSVNSANGMVVENAQFGPDIRTGVQINAATGNAQNLGIFGMSCVGCSILLNDGTTGKQIWDTSLGWYLLGKGQTNTQTALSSNYGIEQQLESNFHSSTTAVGPGNNQYFGTFSVWDATPNGKTSVIEMAGAAQGSQNLQEWRNSFGQPLTSVDATGVLHTLTMQLRQGDSSLGCNDISRGTLQVVPAADGVHDQARICVKASAGTGFQWVYLNQ